MISAASLIVIAYFFGSIPFGAIIAQSRAKIDIREQGSGNIGATNVLRQAGPALGLLTLAADMAKGAIPVAIALLFFHEDILTGVVAASSFTGHLHPVYTGFKKGGKGVATAAGGALVFAPAAVGISFLLFAVVVGASRRASAGSLAASAALAPAVFFIYGSPALTGASLFMAVLIWVRHKDNIKRLAAGEESKIF